MGDPLRIRVFPRLRSGRRGPADLTKSRLVDARRRCSTAALTERGYIPHALPWVSNIAKSIASRGLRPAHSTNWNDWIIGLARLDRRLDDAPALRVARPRAAGEAMGVAEHHDVLAGSTGRNGRATLRVDHPHQFADLGALTLGNLEVEGAADMQRFHVAEPSDRNFVMRPHASDENGDLVLVGAVERPFVERGQTLDDIDGMFGPLGRLVLRGHRELSEGVSGTRGT